MSDDPIVREIRKFREQYAASLGYDLERIVADLKSRQGSDGRMVVDHSSIVQSEQANPADVRNGEAPRGESTAARG